MKRRDMMSLGTAAGTWVHGPMSCGPNGSDRWQRAVTFDRGVNLRPAKTRGLPIPLALRLRADGVIQ